jgi:peptidoglycan-N-acetylglucosamine deacetylase
MALVRQILRSTMAATLPRRRFMVQGPAAGNRVCLTFDDGPFPDHTPRLLDVLRDLRVVATFFVVGRQAETHPDLVRRIAAEGHAVGHHSFTHSEPRETSADQLMGEVAQTRDLLARLTGRPSNLFRPPKGEVTAAKLWRLWRAGQSVVLWNADPKDYKSTATGDVARWFAANPPKAGDIILMHDNRPLGFDALPAVVEDCRRRGLTFDTPLAWTAGSPAPAAPAVITD